MFQVLIQCLESSKPACPTETSETNAIPANRKRSLSISDPMIKKSGASPLPPQRILYETNKKKPEFDQAVFAATVLYTAFQYIKHWPAPLVKAYATDCFGPRLWVDCPECSLFVENLALAHKPADATAKVSSSDENVARLIAESYQISTRSMGQGRFASLEHQLSSSSLGSERVVAKRQTSATSWGSGDDGSAKKRIKPLIAEHDDSVGRSNSEGDMSINHSTSGEDEERQRIKRKREVGDNDESTSVSSKEGDSNEYGESAYATGGNFYPVDFQDVFTTTKPQQRFIGFNLECAHEMVLVSLEERLDTKAKQNSGLLQCLPDFVTVAAVRQEIGSNIERWLQSPALAGLARVLLAATVQHMEDVNPPTKEDLALVNAVLSMKLKSNQVCATTS